MAKTESANLISTFAEFKESKNIDRKTLMSIMEEPFRNVITKTYGSDKNYKIVINPDKGDVQIWRNRIVVEEDKVTDPNLEIPLSEAQKIQEDYEVGEEVTEQVDSVLSAVAPYSTSVKCLLQKYWTFKKILSTRNTVRWLDKSSKAPYIKCGRKKCSCLMTKATNSFSQKQNRFLPTSTTKKIMYVLLL